MFSLLRRTKKSATSTATLPRCVNGSARLGLESLEDRSVPSTFQTVDLSAYANIRMQDYQPSAAGYPEGMVTLGGVPFNIQKAGGNNAWNAEVVSGAYPHVLDVPLNIADATAVHTLINTFYGQPGPTSYISLEFFGSGGAYFKKDLIGNVDVRDHFNAFWTNSVNGTTTTTVYSSGGGMLSESRLDKQEIDLPASFVGQTLTEFRLTSTGGVLVSDASIQGLTVVTGSAPAPDIIVSSVQQLSSTQVQFAYQTTGAPGPFAVGLYLSADQTFDAGDLAIGGPVTITPGSANQSGTGVLTVSDPNVPLWLDAARPYVLVVADPGNAVAELNDTNNSVSFVPPPYIATDATFNNIDLPDVQLPIAVVKTTSLDVQFASLGLNFTALPTAEPGALASVQSNVETLTISSALQSGTGEWILGYSTSQATLTVFGGATPYIRWESMNVHFSPVPPIPDVDLYDTGPITMDVALADLGLTLATPFDTTLRAAEAYFHETLSHNLPYVSSLFSQILVVEDPGSTDLLVTDSAGRQTGRQADGTLVTAIPFSIYDAAAPLVLVFAPQSGTYETDVRGLEAGGYTLVTGTVANLNVAANIQSFSGTLAAGQTEVYSSQVGTNGVSANTRVDAGRTLAFLAPFVISQFETGAIANQGVENALLQKLRVAQQQLDRGDIVGARAALGAFLNQVSAQRGKQISANTADSLTSLTQYLLRTLPSK
jgi:hypothetical protein